MENKVSVKIYGQEYVLSGDKSEEEIKKIADYVDNKMRLIAKAGGDFAPGSLGILSAINIAEEYFDSLTNAEELSIAKTQLENDSKYYLKMWEDAKQNYMKYKENISDMKTKKEEYDEQYKALQAKCTEYENSFFDLQMENIQLKSEISKLKNNG